MRYIADLHIHSLFSRATSKTSHLRGLAAWAAVKGIDVVATGDFTHPGWFAQLYEELVPAEEGFFRLRPDSNFDYAALLPEGLQPGRHPEEIRFILSAEISCIYKRGGRVRKVHNLLYAPDMAAVRRINTALGNLGNISADGRPILGLDSRDLLEIVLEQAGDAFLVPAHIWTPWFSLFGSKSGFDTVEECFADLSEHIFALETGLSSDPAMNRMISALDGYSLISNSDCHSPAKLGREANIFDTGFDFFSLREAIRSPADTLGNQRFLSTVEFFPEEGKYHLDGHRKCGGCFEPRQTRELKGLCPACGKDLTVGVLHRVLELADRDEPVFPAASPEVHSLVPLAELVAELLGVGPGSKKVMAAYSRLISLFGSEFRLLLEAPLEDMHSQGLPLLAEAISRVRRNEVIRQSGCDGVYGVIRVFTEGERVRLVGQQSLFSDAAPQKKVRTPARKKLSAGKSSDVPKTHGVDETGSDAWATASKSRLNQAQRAVVVSAAPVIVVQAGPGTGKTHALVSRVERLLAEGVKNGEHRVFCTVITFTNKAADELRLRLNLNTAGLQAEGTAGCRVATFHGFCLELLRCRRPELAVVGPDERSAILGSLFPQISRSERSELIKEISKFLLHDSGSGCASMVQAYLDYLEQHALIDLDGICQQALADLQEGGEWALQYRRMCGMLFVDEFQDVNAVQYSLVAALAASNPVFCIGDPDQAIYGFRGASPRWFYRLLEDFTAEYHVLTQNYRNGAQILAAATAVIHRNPRPANLPAIRKFEAMEAMNTRPSWLHVQACSGVLAEARFIADQVEVQVGGLSHRGLERMDEPAMAGSSFGDIAILYRTLRQAEVVQAVFAERGIPFQQVELEAYYMRGSCRLLYAWLMLLSGRADVEQLLSLLEKEPGMGEVRIARLQAYLREELRQKDASAGQGLLPLLVSVPAGLVPIAFIQLLQQMQLSAQEAASLPVLLDTLTAALSLHYSFEPQDASLARLQQSAVSFADLQSFAANLERYSDSVLYDPKATAVTLSTLHAAKGLEFDVVFICGCEQELLPLAPREQLEDAALQEHFEEERRLFYVGMTRARSSLYCTWSKLRRGFATSASDEGQGATDMDRRPSSFLFEFSPALISPAPSLQSLPEKKRQAGRQLSLFSSNS
ncbi:MAG: UvrD-helicase domain-containing protein [Desulfobulbaceae bacterium]|nr:UvrD-helicase domain-containing protein [Desulfobulbaceae bacterium]